MFNLLSYIRNKIVHVPKFKVGDVVKYRVLDLDGFIITKVSTNKYIGDYYTIERQASTGCCCVCGIHDNEIELST